MKFLPINIHLKRNEVDLQAIKRPEKSHIKPKVTRISDFFICISDEIMSSIQLKIVNFILLRFWPITGISLTAKCKQTHGPDLN